MPVDSLKVPDPLLKKLASTSSNILCTLHPKHQHNVFGTLVTRLKYPPLSRDRCSNTPVALCFLWYRRLSLLHPHFLHSQSKDRPNRRGIAEDRKNLRVHKNKIGTSTPPPPSKPPPPKTRNFMGMGVFPGERAKNCQAPIKSGQSFPAPELRAEKIRT